VIAVSNAVAAALRRRGTMARKLTVIPNGLIAERVDRPVSDRELYDWRDRVKWEPGCRILGIIARPKDQRVVLAALREVRTPVRLVLAGVDPAGALGAMARAVPPPHAVVCLPYTGDVVPLYKLLDVALLPSRMEGLSQALLEAMALGKPVIASDAGGTTDLIRHGVDGLLVPPMDATAWASAITRLLQDQRLALRLAESGRLRARVTFSLDHTVQRTLALYRTLVPRWSGDG
jgi:glycosyltransferase involved in cell wall biosynthesis